jgi:hypothetical protein
VKTISSKVICLVCVDRAINHGVKQVVLGMGCPVPLQKVGMGIPLAAWASPRGRSIRAEDGSNSLEELDGGLARRDPFLGHLRKAGRVVREPGMGQFSTFSFACFTRGGNHIASRLPNHGIDVVFVPMPAEESFIVFEVVTKRTVAGVMDNG